MNIDTKFEVDSTVWYKTHKGLVVDCTVLTIDASVVSGGMVDVSYLIEWNDPCNKGVFLMDECLLYGTKDEALKSD